MNLTLHLGPEIEARLNEQSVREGQAPEVIALDALQQKLTLDAASAASPDCENLIEYTAPSVGPDIDCPCVDSTSMSIPQRISEDKIKAAINIAQELGFVLLETEVECDPDDSRGPYVSMNVEAPQSMTDILEAQRQWHGRLDSVLGFDHSSIRLCVYPSTR